MTRLEEELQKLPPEERLKRLRKVEAEKEQLEEELKQTKAAVEELEKKRAKLKKLEEKAEELAAVEELEEKTIEELEELEDRVREFRTGKEFVPKKEQEAEGGYTSEPLRKAQENLAYLLYATPSTPERREEVERNLYQNLREVANEFRPEEGYVVNKLQKELHRLKEEGAVASTYVARTDKLLNELTDIIDYKN